MKSNNNSILALQHSGGGSSNLIFKDDVAGLKSIWIEIPDYCHLHCDYCYASTDNKPKKVDKYLSNSDYEKILREFAVLGGKFVGIPGKGEPFHSKNWELTKSIIDLCCQLDLELAIFTTGDSIFFTAHDTVDAAPAMEKMEYIKDKNLILLIKCNSMIPEIQNKLVNDRHNKYTQLRNRAMDILINEYHLNESHKLGIVTSVMKDNENEIVDLFNWAQERNIIFDCDTILERGRGKKFTSSGQVPPKIDLEAVFKRLKKVGAITSCQGGTYVGSTCDRIVHHLYISVEGDIFPCIGCLREDIKENFQLGNIKDLSLEQAWKSRFRQRLANDYKQVFLGTCKKCQNLEDENCYSCMGRCIVYQDPKNDKKAFNEDGTINTSGCIHHKPLTTTWLATVVDYIRKILSFNETKYILNNEGLERLWRPNKNIAFSLLQLSKEDRKRSIQELIALDDPQDHPDYSPYKLITDSRVDNFSKKKHFNFKEISFPMNKVWDFSADPNKIFEGIDIKDEEKNKVIKEISHSFLSNVLLASFKILFEKYDDSDELIRYCNFMLYDSINKKYFYRSIMKDSDSDKSGIRSLIISRWYEDLGHRNFWKEYCYDLSESFSDEIYGEYELKLSNNNKDIEWSITQRTIDLTDILELAEIKEKVEKFFTYTSDENLDFINKFNAVGEIINSTVFSELHENNVAIKNLTELYNSINQHAFFHTDDNKNSSILNNLSISINNLDTKYSGINHPIIKKLKDEFYRVRLSGNGTKFFNYFIYLGIMQKVFEINYYYLLHSTNFKEDDEKQSPMDSDTDYRGIIKPSGILLCTIKQIDIHFHSELKLFISSIFAPIEEYYFRKLYGEVQATKEFNEKVKSHRHSILNIRKAFTNVLKEFSGSTVDCLSADCINKDSLLINIEKLKAVYEIYNIAVLSGITEKSEMPSYFGKTISELINKICFYCNIAYTSLTQQVSIENNNSIFLPSSIDAFTVIFNLAVNAAQTRAYNSWTKKFDYYEITAYTENDYYFIKFRNPAIIDKRCIDFINNDSINLEKFIYNDLIKEWGGLSISKRLCKKLKWTLSVCIENEWTIFLITINSKNYGI